MFKGLGGAKAAARGGDSTLAASIQNMVSGGGPRGHGGEIKRSDQLLGEKSRAACPNT